MILWENEDVQFTGAPSAVGLTTLTYGNNVLWPPNQFPGALLYVDNGPGMGTWRRIISNPSNTIMGRQREARPMWCRR